LGDIVQFKKKKTAEKHKGNMLCRRGFHKWEIDKEKEFDVSRGKLVTVYRCKRCGKEKIEAK